jgi:5-(carboxyamino)imidazole ribonucleotide mutase
VRILAAADPGLRDRMADFQRRLREQAREKGAALRASLGGEAAAAPPTIEP